MVMLSLHDPTSAPQKGKTTTVRMKSPPWVFFDAVRLDQWAQLSDADQDKLIEAAKVLLKINKK